MTARLYRSESQEVIWRICGQQGRITITKVTIRPSDPLLNLRPMQGEGIHNRGGEQSEKSSGEIKPWRKGENCTVRRVITKELRLVPLTARILAMGC